MVTKLSTNLHDGMYCSVLAKILMVTKQMVLFVAAASGSVLAKILMVTKQPSNHFTNQKRSVLAKILMVTKQDMEQL